MCAERKPKQKNCFELQSFNFFFEFQSFNERKMIFGIPCALQDLAATEKNRKNHKLKRKKNILNSSLIHISTVKVSTLPKVFNLHSKE